MPCNNCDFLRESSHSRDGDGLIGFTDSEDERNSSTDEKVIVVDTDELFGSTMESIITGVATAYATKILLDNS